MAVNGENLESTDISNFVNVVIADTNILTNAFKLIYMHILIYRLVLKVHNAKHVTNI